MRKEKEKEEMTKYKREKEKEREKMNKIERKNEKERKLWAEKWFSDSNRNWRLFGDLQD